MNAPIPAKTKNTIETETKQEMCGTATMVKSVEA